MILFSNILERAPEYAGNSTHNWTCSQPWPDVGDNKNTVKEAKKQEPWQSEPRLRHAERATPRVVFMGWYRTERYDLVRMARSRSNHHRHFGRHRHQTEGYATCRPHELDVDGTARAPGGSHHRRLPGVSSPIRRLTLSHTVWYLDIITGCWKTHLWLNFDHIFHHKWSI